MEPIEQSESNTSALNTSDASNHGTSNGIELPKGGGAIRGISEQFKTNAVTGSANFSLPIPISPARGFQPDVALSYDSGSGNSEFGLGWQVGIASIDRKTSNQLPSYNDASDSDVYVMAGSEDLVPFLKPSGDEWIEFVNNIELVGINWEVKQYRPRIESGYSKIERWRDPQSNRIWWRTVSSTNITTVFGFHDQACVFEPSNRAKTFKWMIDFSYDDKGHFTQYCYKRENQFGVDFNLPSESHRKDTPYSKLYLKKILYGIKSSRINSGYSDQDIYSQRFYERDRDFHFQTVFDYGDHSESSFSVTADINDWPARADAFSSYKAGFEIRTYRLCSRVMLFHDFPELGDEPELVKSLHMQYSESHSSFSFLNAAFIRGYKREGGVMAWADMPAVEFEYQQHHWNQTLQKLDDTSMHNLPAGVDEQSYQWVDLYSEGLSGVLTEQAGALYYKQNLGGGKLGKAARIASSPSLKGLSDGWNFQDLESNGIKLLVSTNGVTKGYFEFQQGQEWRNFESFNEFPNISFNDKNLKIIDLNGDGQADLLITEDNVLRWYPSKGKHGFDDAEFAPQPENKSDAKIIFSTQGESIFTADMSGDGLTDIVRVRNGCVEYWPNKGFGHFGKKVTMSNAPMFNHSDIFMAGHIRLADIDGSGTNDLIYLGKSELRYWLNGSGNTWSESHKVVNPFPDIDNLSTVSVTDLLGTGTACVVWSTTLPASANTSIHYVDLMGGQKPHLMRAYKNGFGKSINLEYTPSTQFYLEDKQKGEPWVTKLHFPVHCLSKVETVDHITGARFASSYTYHHGYYDHAEREFRGFGRVDQIDTEAYEHFVKGNSTNVSEKVLHQTPVLVKTWFHNGAYIDQDRILDQYRSEYCDYENSDYDHLRPFQLAQPQLPNDLSVAEWREALRACKGMALRTETYGLDGTPQQDKPFSIAYNTCRIKHVQQKKQNRYAVFQVLNSESMNILLDRQPADPRISHNLLLDVNDYGQPSLSAVVSYGRNPQMLESDLPSHIQAAQLKAHCVISEVEYTNDEYGPLGQHKYKQFDSVLRAPVAWKNNSFQFGINDWQWTDGVFETDALLAEFRAVPINQYVAYLRQANNVDVVDVDAGQVRLLGSTQSYFINESLDGPLPEAQQSSTGLGWNNFQLAFTPELVQSIYGDKVDSNSLLGNYVDINADGNWWTGTGHSIYQTAQSPILPHENFFIPLGARDALGAASWTDLDNYSLLPVGSSVSRVGYDASDSSLVKLNKSVSVNDYRLLSPKFTRDANDNWVAVEVDALGIVTKSAVMGKVPTADINNPPANDALTEGDNLDNPSAEMAYGFYDAETNQPAWVKSRTYTQHFAVQQIPRDQLVSRLDFLEQFEYTDGSGNVVMTKAQTTPGIAKQLQSDGGVIEVDTRTLASTDRWIGNGRMIINNKGNPVKQYEPYFSITHEYESADALVETGISPILFYDAAGRNICKLHPDKTYEKVVFDAWHQQSWDANDTVFLPQPDGSKETDITRDTHVGHLFAALESVEVAPSWYAKRIDSSDAQQKRAAELTELHVATPAISYTDSLGRSVYELAHNRYKDKDGNVIEEHYATQTVQDIEGNSLSVIDARGNQVMRFRYNMLPPPDEENPKPSLYQNSMDGGEKWTLFSAQGHAHTGWDSRDHVVTSFYDGLHRPSHTVLYDGAQHKRINWMEYADSDHTNAQSIKLNNLIGTAIKSYDQAGRTTTDKIDFKGNVLSASRTLVGDYKNTIDWGAELDGQLDNEMFVSNTQFDAINRVTTSVSPHHNGISPSHTQQSYNEAGALGKMLVSIRSDNNFSTHVEKIEHDAKGQREYIEYGNGVFSTYQYEPDTYRLSKLVTTSASGKKLQDLNYFYDPVGNITDIRDSAQNTVFYNNDVVEPHNSYEYDATYQLKRATGREHATQANIPNPRNGWVGLRTSDDLALQRYVQTYEYDSVGNIKVMSHRRPKDNNTGWTRHYQYAEDSNRLLATTLGDNDLPFEQQYSYNNHGSISSMQHLPTMEWDFAEQLRHVDLQGGGDAYYVYDSNGERLRKIIETNGSTNKDRIYLGEWEIYIERNNVGKTLVRESLSVLDDEQRIAMIDIKTLGPNDGEGLQPLTRYQLANHIGSIGMELNDSAEIISYEEFHPYGTTAFHASSSVLTASQKRYRYTGKERDDETGFSYHGARYLCSWLTRWISVDPIGIGDGVNLYMYCHASPIHSVDSKGLSTEEEESQMSSFTEELFQRHKQRLERQRAEYRNEYLDQETDALFSNIQKAMANPELDKKRLSIQGEYGTTITRTVDNSSGKEVEISRTAAVPTVMFRHYRHVDEESEKRILRAIVDRANEHGFDPAFLASAIFGEGLNNYVTSRYRRNPDSTVNNFHHIGADRFTKETDVLKSKGLLRENFQEETVKDYKVINKIRSERKEVIEEIELASIEVGVEAMAAMLAERRDTLLADLSAAGFSKSDLETNEFAYWNYLYYNAGSGTGKSHLESAISKGSFAIPTGRLTLDKYRLGDDPIYYTKPRSRRIAANMLMWDWVLSGGGN